MNRRAFFSRIGKGVVAVAVLATIPASVIKTTEWLTTAGQRWASEQLVKAWHAHYKLHGKPVGAFRVGAELYKLYESELLASERFCYTNGDYDTPNLMCKGAIVYVGTQFVTHTEVRALGPYEIQTTNAVEYRVNTTVRQKHGA